VALTVLPVSLAFLWYNSSPLFDQDDPTKLGNFIAVYIIGLSVWMCLLIPANSAFMLLQFLYAIQTVRAGLQTHDGNGTLSLVGLLLQAAAFLWLAVAQTLRSWSRILWPDPGSCRSVGRFLEWFSAFYGTINTHVAYFVAGVGYLVLFCVDLLDSRGRIRL
jgi:hypothetical protein